MRLQTFPHTSAATLTAGGGGGGGGEGGGECPRAGKGLAEGPRGEEGRRCLGRGLGLCTEKFIKSTKIKIPFSKKVRRVKECSSPCQPALLEPHRRQRASQPRPPPSLEAQPPTLSIPPPRFPSTGCPGSSGLLWSTLPVPVAISAAAPRGPAAHNPVERRTRTLGSCRSTPRGVRESPAVGDTDAGRLAPGRQLGARPRQGPDLPHLWFSHKQTLPFRGPS